MKPLPVAMLLVLLFVGCDGPKSAPTPPPKPVPQTPPLSVGDRLPPLRAEGWVNGPPPAPDGTGVRLMLIDLWARWCPYCPQGAPLLAKLNAKYRPAGVVFVSLTNHGPEALSGYLRGELATWPSGYGIDREMIIDLGGGSGMMLAGYAVSPVVYLVDPSGTIVWTDGRGRPRHIDPDKWAAELDEAIAAHLAPQPPAKP